MKVIFEPEVYTHTDWVITMQVIPAETAVSLTPEGTIIYGPTSDAAGVFKYEGDSMQAVVFANDAVAFMDAHFARVLVTDQCDVVGCYAIPNGTIIPGAMFNPTTVRSTYTFTSNTPEMGIGVAGYEFWDTNTPMGGIVPIPSAALIILLPLLVLMGLKR